VVDTGIVAFRDGKTWPLVQQQVTVANVNAVVGAVSAAIVPANYNRKFLQITNNDVAQYVYLGFGAPAVLHFGIRLGPYNTEYYIYVMDRESIFSGEVRAIATAPGTVVTILEASG
jgi:hypothetical protein